MAETKRKKSSQVIGYKHGRAKNLDSTKGINFFKDRGRNKDRRQ